jgi:hypothetical protein
MKINLKSIINTNSTPIGVIELDKYNVPFYSPSALSEGEKKQSNINQREEQKLRVLLKLKRGELEKIQEQEKTVENYEELLTKENALMDVIQDISDRIESEVFSFIALVCRLDKKDLIEKIQVFLDGIDTDYSINQLGDDIFNMIVVAIKKHNEANEKKIEALLNPPTKSVIES